LFVAFGFSKDTASSVIPIVEATILSVLMGYRLGTMFGDVVFHPWRVIRKLELTDHLHKPSLIVLLMPTSIDTRISPIFTVVQIKDY
jgi:hypothetical protein